MKIAAFTFADAASTSNGVNLLGGWRYIRKVRQLPITLPTVIVAVIEATAEEVGPVHIKVDLEMPGKKATTLVDTDVELKARPNPADAGLPITAIMHGRGDITFETEGVHTVRARIGRLRTESQFLIRLAPQAEDAEVPDAE